MNLPPSPLTLTLLRHGRSRADDEGVHEGRYDSPLTSAGEAQAAKLAAYWLANPPGFERIVCSSLEWARRTAEIIGEALGLTITPDDACASSTTVRWRGSLSTRLSAAIPNRPFGTALRPILPTAVRPTQRRRSGSVGRSRHSCRVRRAGCSWWRTAVVSTSRFALRDLLGAPVATSFTFGDTSFSEVWVSRASDRVRLLSLDRAPHLLVGA